MGRRGREGRHGCGGSRNAGSAQRGGKGGRRVAETPYVRMSKGGDEESLPVLEETTAPKHASDVSGRRLRNQRFFCPEAACACDRFAPGGQPCGLSLVRT